MAGVHIPVRVEALVYCEKVSVTLRLPGEGVEGYENLQGGDIRQRSSVYEGPTVGRYLESSRYCTEAKCTNRETEDRHER